MRCCLAAAAHHVARSGLAVELDPAHLREWPAIDHETQERLEAVAQRCVFDVARPADVASALGWAWSTATRWQETYCQVFARECRVLGRT